MSNARASLGVRLPRDLLRQAASRVRSAPGRCCRTWGGGRGPGARGPGARAGLEVEKGEVGRGSKAKPGPEGISPASGGCARPRAPSAKRPVGYVPVSLSLEISGGSIGRTTAQTPLPALSSPNPPRPAPVLSGRPPPPLAAPPSSLPPPGPTDRPLPTTQRP